MKTTKNHVTAYVRMMLGSNEAWALKALVRIFKENQTADEQAAETTSHDNGIGFSGTDANFLSSLAKQYLERGRLSHNQKAAIYRTIPKYHKQVIGMSDPVKLKALVDDYYYESYCESEEANRNERRAHG